MHKASVSVLMFAVFAMPSGSTAQDKPASSGKTFTMSGELLRAYQDTQRNLREAAEKMPEEHYGFRPTSDVRPFGQIVAHIALSQFGTCAALKGEPSPRKDEKEEASRTKTETIVLLEASAEYCNPTVNALTEQTMTELTKVGEKGDNQAAKGLLPVSLVVHGMETYGALGVYLRLKGVVPPTTARQKEKMKDSQ
ncbi:MAG: DinB family protein [Vicinamibacteraceae bacterium]